jgi:epoxyqueuosine reductase QueG
LKGIAVQDTSPTEQITYAFQRMCAEVDREGVIGFANTAKVRLMPEQQRYLEEKLRVLGPTKDFTAVSLGLLYHEEEVTAIPAQWRARPSPDDRWGEYAQAYEELNRLLDRIVSALANSFHGVAEQATLAGWGARISHVSEYYPHCVSHRAFAAAAGLGWRGRHSLIVTPEAGPALRFATLFIPENVQSQRRRLAGCGDCRACLDVCAFLREIDDHREPCRRRLNALGLGAEVCGICMRVCWEQIRR